MSTKLEPLSFEMVRKIVDYIVKESTENTESGNYIIYYEDIAKKFSAEGVTEEKIKLSIDSIEAYLSNREEVLDVEWDDESIDANYGLSYCYGIDYEAEENRELAPNAEIMEKIDIYMNDSRYDKQQIIQIKAGLIDGLPVEEYADPGIPADEMKNKRRDLAVKRDFTCRYHVGHGTSINKHFATAKELNEWYDKCDTEGKYFCRLYDQKKLISITGSEYMWLKEADRWKDDDIEKEKYPEPEPEPSLMARKRR